MTRINGVTIIGGGTRHLDNGQPDEFLASWKGCDGPQSVNLCLHCSKAKCDNCLDGSHAADGRNGRPKKYDYTFIASLIKRGIASCHVARMAGCPPYTVAYIKKKLKEEGMD